MKVGLLVNVNNHTVDPGTLGAAVEEAGFESLWMGDHPVIPYVATTPMPGTGGEIPEAYAHVSDPFVSLAMAAARTSNLKLGTGVLVLPNRNPIITALQASTLDYFSGGRLLFGVGAGWLQDQLEVLGADYPRRLRQAREYVEAIRALWSDPEQPFEGEWTSFPQLKLNPRPATKGGPKVHLGTWGEKAPARVAAWADAWLPMLVSPEELEQAMRSLEEECAKVDRDASDIEVTLFEYEPGGNREMAQDFLQRYSDAGADRVVMIQGLGDEMGSNEWDAWGPDNFRDHLEAVASRFL